MRACLIGLSLALAGCGQPKPILASWATQLGQVTVKSQAPLQVVLAGFDAKGNCLQLVDQTLSAPGQTTASFSPGSKVFVCLRHPASQKLGFDLEKVRSGDAKATSELYQRLSDWRANCLSQAQRGGQPAIEVGAHRPTTANPANPPAARKSSGANTLESAVPSARPAALALSWTQVTVTAEQPNVQLYEP